MNTSTSTLYRIVTMDENGSMKTVETTDLSDYEITGYNDNHRQRSELQGQPRLKGMNGPCWDGDAIRYECTKTYAALSN